MFIQDELKGLGNPKTSRLDVCLCGFIGIILFLGCYLYLIPLLIGAGINYTASEFDYNICEGIIYWCYPLLGLGVYVILLIILIIFICCLVCIAKLIGCWFARNKYDKVYSERVFDDEEV